MRKKYQGASRGGYHAEIRSSNLVQIVSKIQFFSLLAKFGKRLGSIKDIVFNAVRTAVQTGNWRF